MNSTERKRRISGGGCAISLPDRLYGAPYDRFDAGVREICDANGLSEDTFVREVHLLPSVDMFMSNLEDIHSLGFFGGLIAICFINVPNITSVAGLDKCCPGELPGTVRHGPAATQHSSRVGVVLDVDSDYGTSNPSKVPHQRIGFHEISHGPGLGSLTHFCSISSDVR